MACEPETQCVLLVMNKAGFVPSQASSTGPAESIQPLDPFDLAPWCRRPATCDRLDRGAEIFASECADSGEENAAFKKIAAKKPTGFMMQCLHMMLSPIAGLEAYELKCGLSQALFAWRQSWAY
jgi:hypothetical protein